MTDIDQLGDELRASLLVAAQEVRLPPDLAERLLTSVPAGTSSGRAARPPMRGWVRPVIAAAATIAVVAGVTSVVANHRSPSAPASRPAVVAWNAADQKALTVPIGPLPAIVTPPARIGAPKGLRACTNTDLRLVWSQSQPGGQQGLSVLTSYRLQSIAATSCSVSTYGLNAELVDSTGTALPEDARMPAGPVRIPSDLLVTPGQLVTGFVTWSVVKAKAPRPMAIALLASGPDSTRPDARLSIPIADVSAPPNPPNPSNIGPWRAGWYSGSPSVQDPASLNSLVANVIGPASLATGQVLHAQVRLENQTTEPVTLSPCPEVVVTLDVVPVKDAYVTGTRGPLNCAQAPKVVKPGGSVTFAVQVPTEGEPSGTGRLTWSLVVDRYAVVQGATNVTVVG
jgi:hypothetical protein